MALGNNRPRNWGKDSQEAALAILLSRRNVAYEVKGDRLLVWPKNATCELRKMATTVATLENTKRGEWTSNNPFDGSIIAKSCSQRDCIRKTIEQRWL